jgi:hypothetical protein
MMSECKAAVFIKGGYYRCDMTPPHDGWAHGNKDAEAVWYSDTEADQFMEDSE